MPLLFAALMLFGVAASAAEIDQTGALSALRQPGAVLIDVRSAEEYAEGALRGSTRIDPFNISKRITSVVPDKSMPVVLYCRSGRRASVAQQELRALGYGQVINAGGFEELKSVLRAD